MISGLKGVLRILLSPGKYSLVGISGTTVGRVWPASALFGSDFLLRNERKRNPVYAIPKSGGLGTVIENVSLMAAAAGAVDLCSGPEETFVFTRPDILGCDRLPETWPAGPGIELMLRGEKIEAAGGAPVNSFFLVIIEFTGKRSFGPLLAEDVELFFGKYFFPFTLGFNDFIHCYIPTFRS